MVKIGDPPIHLGPKQKLTIEIATVCASTKLQKPPPAVAQKYKVGPYPDKGLGELIQHIVETSERLEQQGSFNTLAVSPQQRARKVAQMTIWRVTGERAHESAAQITKASLRADIMSGINVEWSQLKADQRARIERFVEEMDKAISLTLANCR